MVKKTKKGGVSILEKIPFINVFKNANKKGIYIADDVDYNIRQGKKKDLIKKYEDYLNEAKENVIMAKEENNRDDEYERIKNEREKRTLEERKFKYEKFKNLISLILNIAVYVINLILNIIGKIGVFIDKFSKTFFKVLTNIFSGIKNFFNIGGGVIIKTIAIIVFIIAIFFSVNHFIHKDDPTKKNNLISTDKNYSSCLINTKTPNFFGNISNSFYNLIPDNYKIQFNFFKNRFNSIIGNDIYEIIGTPREKIETGINDGIYHIKKTDDNSNTYTTLKPKDIEISMSSITLNPNNDFNKLPEKIKELYSITDKLIIPIEIDDKNQWKYNIRNIKYKSNPSIRLESNNYSNPFQETGTINEFKYNKIKADVYKKDNNKVENMFIYDTKYIYPLIK